MAGASVVGHLVDRHPTVSPERLIAQLVPPPTFTDVSFESYRPDPAEPSQEMALESCVSFCDEAVRRRAGRKKLFGKRETLPGVGLYLDGGFGVGKTHLLASAYRYLPLSAENPKAFATFGELTQLASVFGFIECIDLLGDYTVVCIDEFELDDPGNTTLISRLLSQLVERGVSVAATSNTCPSNSARAGLRPRTFCGKSTRWQAFSPQSGSRGRTIGTAVCRRRRSRCPTRRRLPALSGRREPRWTTSTSCAPTWPPCTRRGI